ncbi:MAG: hypothetical protein JO043_05535, partial [Candidatus Eremiobacteraeota bacterium]|nr:hypothetical protein [Candidatus Eremiobacteraeota bacterium]
MRSLRSLLAPWALSGMLMGALGAPAEAGRVLPPVSFARPHVQDPSSEQVIYDFGNTRCDGMLPVAPLLPAKDGSFFGTTEAGGCFSGGYGTVYQLVRNGSSYSDSVLYAFEGYSGNSGSIPEAGVVSDSSGNLYGTTYAGGGSTFSGTAYELIPGKPSYSEKVLWAFQNNAPGGAWPMSTPAWGKNGHLYVTTSIGGSSCSAGGVLDVSTGQVVHEFGCGSDGATPMAGVVVDKHGNMFGTTQQGGTSGLGTVFEISQSGGESVIYSFRGGADGAYPEASITIGPGGKLYGTTTFGGTGKCQNAEAKKPAGCGTVFQLAPHKHGYTEKVLYSFQGGNDGNEPVAGITRNASGVLYGTTYLGGSANAGTVYELVPSLG